MSKHHIQECGIDFAHDLIATDTIMSGDELIPTLTCRFCGFITHDGRAVDEERN